MTKLNNGLACNPYLPSKEYIPDAEPYLFGNRVYIYGSHDIFGGSGYCEGSYVCWSASVDDLSSWRYEGVILEKGLDPLDPDGQKSYFAPDLAQGPDGRYYLYYSIEDSSVISVAVCDQPAGQYSFHGHVKDKAGHVLGSQAGDRLQFDPAVLVDDDQRIFMYSGQGIPIPEINKRKVAGALVCELEPDMITTKTTQRTITSSSENTFVDNPFFEASSIRKFGKKYYFIYSPIPDVHNLCYAMSDYPDRDFIYQGVLISNANIFQDHHGRSKSQYYWGNNHGSLIKIKESFLVFYHRHTNRSSWNRQGCVERISMTVDGRFKQAAMTSTGAGNPFPLRGEYGAYIACQLHKAEGIDFQPFEFYEYSDADPYITQDETTPHQYIANIKNGSTIGFDSFEYFAEKLIIELKIKGNCQGVIEITKGDKFLLAKVEVESTENWKKFRAPLISSAGVEALRMKYVGSGQVDLLSFSFFADDDPNN